jgi:hypothetical protein
MAEDGSIVTNVQLLEKMSMFWRRSEWCFFYTHSVSKGFLLSLHIDHVIGENSKPKGVIYLDFCDVYKRWQILHPLLPVSQSTFYRAKPQWISKGKIEECGCFVGLFKLIFVF